MTAINFAEMFRAEKRKQRQARSRIHKYELPGLTDIEDYKLDCNIISTVFYIPNFLSKEDEDALVNYVCNIFIISYI